MFTAAHGEADALDRHDVAIVNDEALDFDLIRWRSLLHHVSLNPHHREAAVDGDGRAGHKVRSAAGEEHGDAAHVIWSSPAAGWRALQNGRAPLWVLVDRPRQIRLEP